MSRTETCLEKRWAFTEPKPSQPISSAASRPGQALAEDTAPWTSPLPEDGNAEQGGDAETVGLRQGSRPPAGRPGSARSGPGPPVSLQEAPCGPGVSHVRGAEGVSGRSSPSEHTAWRWARKGMWWKERRKGRRMDGRKKGERRGTGREEGSRDRTRVAVMLLSGSGCLSSELPPTYIQASGEPNASCMHHPCPSQPGSN